MTSKEWDWTRTVVDHLDVHASRYTESVRFYETALTPLGIPKLYERESEACFTNLNVVDREPPTTNLTSAFTPIATTDRAITRRTCSTPTATTSKRSIGTLAIQVTLPRTRCRSRRHSRTLAQVSVDSDIPIDQGDSVALLVGNERASLARRRPSRR